MNPEVICAACLRAGADRANAKVLTKLILPRELFAVYLQFALTCKAGALVPRRCRAFVQIGLCLRSLPRRDDSRITIWHPNYLDRRTLENHQNEPYGAVIHRPCFDGEPSVGQLDRITQQPDVMGGRACIRGLRVTVGMVVGQIGAGRSVDEVFSDYP